MRAPHSPRPPIRPVLALGVAVVAVLAIAPVVALAHAELATVVPADKSTVSPPTEIVMTFTERLDPTKSSITVVDAGGATVAQGGTIPATDSTGQEMDLTLPTPLQPGSYQIRWTTFSADDQEFDRGTTTFTVVAGSSPAPDASGVGPSVPAASVAVTVAPSAPPATPAASTGDAVIPVVAALIVVAALGLWLMRGRSRGAR